MQAKVKVGSLRRINTTVERAVQKMVNTLESVNYTKLNTSRGKLYDNKGDVRRSFLLHQSMFIVSNIIVISLYSSFLQVY